LFENKIVIRIIASSLIVIIIVLATVIGFFKENSISEKELVTTSEEVKEKVKVVQETTENQTTLIETVTYVKEETTEEQTTEVQTTELVTEPITEAQIKVEQVTQAVVSVEENKVPSKVVELTLPEVENMVKSGQNFILVISMTYCPYCSGLKEEIKVNNSGYTVYFLEFDLIDQITLREKFANSPSPLAAVEEDLGIPLGSISHTPLPVNFKGGSASIPYFSGNMSGLISIMNN